MPATDRPLGLVLLALGALAGASALLIGEWGGAWGPRTVPLLAAATLALSGVAIARHHPSPSAVHPPRAVEGEPGPPASDDPASERGVALLLGLAILYVLAIDRVGYLIATALTVPATFWLFGVRRPLSLLVAGVAVPLALHLVFFRILGVFPPLGAWFDLLDHLPL